MKILRKILGLDKLLEERGELLCRVSYLKKEVSNLERSEAEHNRARSGHWTEEQKHRETIERLKKEKEEIIESLANIDGFRGIKTLLNNMVQPTLIKEK